MAATQRGYLVGRAIPLDSEYESEINRDNAPDVEGVEIAAMYGVSKQAVSQAEQKAVDKIAPALLSLMAAMIPGAWDRMSEFERAVVVEHECSGRNIVREVSMSCASASRRVHA